MAEKRTPLAKLEICYTVSCADGSEYILHRGVTRPKEGLDTKEISDVVDAFMSALT